MSSKENVTPNNNVIINPYQMIANGGRVEQAATVRNPYKKSCSRNKEDITLQNQMMSNTKVHKNISELYSNVFAMTSCQCFFQGIMRENRISENAKIMEQIFEASIFHKF